MALRHVVFLRNQRSQFGVLQAFTEGLEEAFKRLGIKTDVYDFDDYESGKIIPKITASRPDCTIGFDILLPEDSPLRGLKIPHYAPLSNAAPYYPELRFSKHMLTSFMEEDSCGFYKRLGVENVFFLPQAISRELLPSKGTNLATQKRDLDVVMASNFVNPDAISKVWKEQLSTASYDAMHNLAERVLASPNVSHLQAFFELVEERGPFEKELLDKKLDFFSQLNFLEIYIHNVDRLRMVQSIEGYTVHIYCAKDALPNWQQALKNKKNIRYEEPVSFKELAGIFGRARCVLNSMPTIKRGLHERLLVALSQGASVLSSENIFISSQFYQQKALLEVLSPNYSYINVLLEKAFANEEARLADVISTHKTIEENHTWDARAKTLAETLPPFLNMLKK